jgi:N-acetylglucosaminyldiphosphoundecaprenol N-acetyl-beta-D-mannosaminyltransferase
MAELMSKAIAEVQEPLRAFNTSYAPSSFTMPDIDSESEYANVLGVKVSAINMDGAIDMADRWIAAGNPGYACVTAVHVVMEAQKDRRYLQIINRAAFNLPDGMPLSWVGWLQGHREMDRVSGPSFMLAMCELSAERGYRNFFYGGDPGVAESLRDSLQKRFPGLQVVGTYTPPFRSLNPEEESAFLAQVREARPHIIWVGLGAPKQERFMAQFVDQLHVPLMIGVGAAFDYHTGRLRDCSNWIKRAGLQWLHRLVQDPKRLWKRYLRANPAFLLQIALQLSGLRRNARD